MDTMTTLNVYQAAGKFFQKIAGQYLSGKTIIS